MRSNPVSSLVTCTSLSPYCTLSKMLIKSNYLQQGSHNCILYCTIMSGSFGVDCSVSHSDLHLSTKNASGGCLYICARNPLTTALKFDSLSRWSPSPPSAAVASDMFTKFCRSLTSEKHE